MPIIRHLVLLCFFLTSLGPLPSAQAQVIRATVKVAPTLVVEIPTATAMVKGLTIHPDNPLQFDMIVEPNVGDGSHAVPNQGDHKGSPLREESLKLIKYFLASLTTPEKDMWVNLSPYEKNRIIPEGFGATLMGCDLLGNDYILKQMTASLIHPDSQTGKEFWAKVYKQAQEKFGTTNVSINTFNKVWIMPDKATVWEHGNSVFVIEQHLKVMLEEDYLAMTKHDVGAITNRPIEQGRLITAPTGTNQIASKIVRDIVIPVLEREINEGESFAQLRQIYNAMILATWFKKRLKDSLLGAVYVDQNKTNGIHYDVRAPLAGTQNGIRAGASPAPTDINRIYQQYLQTFKKGVFNFIKEDPDPATGEMIPRKYFSGGMVGVSPAMLVTIDSDVKQLPSAAQAALPSSQAMRVVFNTKPSAAHAMKLASMAMTQDNIGQNRSKFKSSLDMKQFFEFAYEKRSIRPGWWISFDMDHGKLVNREKGKEAATEAVRVLNEVIFEGFASSLDTRFFSSLRTNSRPIKEDGYIYFPEDFTESDLMKKLNDIRIMFKERTGQTVSLSAIKSQDTQDLQINQLRDVLDKMLDMAKTENGNYGDKVILYDPKFRLLETENIELSRSVPESKPNPAMPVRQAGMQADSAMQTKRKISTDSPVEITEVNIKNELLAFYQRTADYGTTMEGFAFVAFKEESTWNNFYKAYDDYKGLINILKIKSPRRVEYKTKKELFESFSQFKTEIVKQRILERLDEEYQKLLSTSKEEIHEQDSFKEFQTSYRSFKEALEIALGYPALPVRQAGMQADSTGMEDQSHVIVMKSTVDIPENVRVGTSNKIIVIPKINRISLASSFELMTELFEDLLYNDRSWAYYFQNLFNELVSNAIYRPDVNGKGGEIEVNGLVYQNEGRTIFKISIHQPLIGNTPEESKRLWDILRRNSILSLEELYDLDHRDREGLIINEGMGLHNYARLALSKWPLHLEYVKDEQGGLTTNLWIQVNRMPTKDHQINEIQSNPTPSMQAKDGAVHLHFATIEDLLKLYREIKNQIDIELPVVMHSLKFLIGLIQKRDQSRGPIIVWQNLRLGEMYPFLSDPIFDPLKRALGIEEVENPQENLVLWQRSPELIPESYKNANMLLVKIKKASSTIKGDTKLSNDLLVEENVAAFAEQMHSDVVMIDSSEDYLSKAQKRVREVYQDRSWIFFNPSKDIRPHKASLFDTFFEYLLQPSPGGDTIKISIGGNAERTLSEVVRHELALRMMQEIKQDQDPLFNILRSPAMQAQKIVIHSSVDIPEDHLLRNGGFDHDTIIRGKVSQDIEQIKLFYEQTKLKIINLFPRLSGVDVEGFYKELLYNTLYASPEESPGESLVEASIYQTTKSKYLKVEIEQQYVSDEDWRVLNNNSELSKAYPKQLGIEEKIGGKRMYHRGGTAFIKYSDFSIWRVPVHFEFERNEHGRMTTTFWIKVDDKPTLTLPDRPASMQADEAMTAYENNEAVRKTVSLLQEIVHPIKAELDAQNVADTISQIDQWVGRNQDKADTFFMEEGKEELELLRKLSDEINAKFGVIDGTLEQQKPKFKISSTAVYSQGQWLADGSSGKPNIFYDFTDKWSKMMSILSATQLSINLGIRTPQTTDKKIVRWAQRIHKVLREQYPYYVQMLQDILNSESMDKTLDRQGFESLGRPQDIYNLFLIPAHSDAAMKANYDSRSIRMKAAHRKQLSDIVGQHDVNKFIEFAKIENPMNIELIEFNPTMKLGVSGLVIKLNNGEERRFFVKTRMPKSDIIEKVKDHELGPVYFVIRNGGWALRLIEYSSLGIPLNELEINNEEEIIKLISSMAYSLGRLHGLGIVHHDLSYQREADIDLKKEHIYIEKKDGSWVTRFIDFDISRSYLGTGGFFSSEQALFFRQVFNFVKRKANIWLAGRSYSSIQILTSREKFYQILFNEYSRGFKETSSRAMLVDSLKITTPAMQADSSNAAMAAKQKHLKQLEDAVGVKNVKSFLKFAKIDLEDIKSINTSELDSLLHAGVWEISIDLKSGRNLKFFMKMKRPDLDVIEKISEFDLGPKYLVLEDSHYYIEYKSLGRSLEDFVLTSKEEVKTLVSSMAYSLGRLHGLGIIHEDLSYGPNKTDDLKLEHIFVEEKTDRWIARFIDFHLSNFKENPVLSGFLAEKNLFFKQILGFIASNRHNWPGRRELLLTKMNPLRVEMRDILENEYKRGYEETKAQSESLKKDQKDRAMQADSGNKAMNNDLGGIDMNSNNLQLTIKRDGYGMPLPASLQDWSSIQIDGFEPVIIKMEPVNLQELIGMP